MKFLSFMDSFFIVNKIAEISLFDLYESIVNQMVVFLVPLDSWLNFTSIDQNKSISIVGKFRENWPALRG